MNKLPFNPETALSRFWDAPESAVFDQKVISIVTDRSTASLERSRWIGFGGPCFIKIGRSVRYRKCDVLDYIKHHKVYHSTTEAQKNGEYR